MAAERPGPLTEHTLRTTRHTTGYLACGPDDGALLVFCHGWPELGRSWRRQLEALGALGFRCLAPDMRGYGTSSVPADTPAYRHEEVVADMLELLDSTGREQAVWVGHDWGAPIVWAIASHHPERTRAVAALCVPHLPAGFDGVGALIDREIYPADRYPYGQWDYQVYYQQHFDEVAEQFERDADRLVAALFRRGDPAVVGKPALTASITEQGGWFGGGRVPDVPVDRAVLGVADHAAYVAALTRTGFRGPNAWYLNGRENGAYAGSAIDDGRLTMPTLFLHARYDTICETVESRLADPMRETCTDLTEVVVDSGHWMAQERPIEVNGALAGWLARSVPDWWPVSAR